MFKTNGRKKERRSRTSDTIAASTTTQQSTDSQLQDDSSTSTVAEVTDSNTFARESSSNGYLEWSELSRMLDSVVYEHPLQVNAPAVHKGFSRGRGVTVAVIDTGLWWEADTQLEKSPIARFDTTAYDIADDPHGHGTHVANIICSDRLAENMVYEGIAPDANIPSRTRI